jgi:hypothetical protein
VAVRRLGCRAVRCPKILGSRYVKKSRRFFRSLDGAQETVADAGHRFDESWLTWIVAQQSPEQGNVAGEGILRNRCVSPNPGQQFFFRNQLVRIPEQQEQNAERFRFHLLHLSRSDDGELPFAHSYIPESENERLSCERGRHHNFFRNTSGVYQDDCAESGSESCHRRALELMLGCSPWYLCVSPGVGSQSGEPCWTGNGESVAQSVLGRHEILCRGSQVICAPSHSPPAGDLPRSKSMSRKQ